MEIQILIYSACGVGAGAELPWSVRGLSRLLFRFPMSDGCWRLGYWAIVWAIVWSHVAFGFPIAIGLLSAITFFPISDGYWASIWDGYRHEADCRSNYRC